MAIISYLTKAEEPFRFESKAFLNKGSVQKKEKSFGEFFKTKIEVSNLSERSS